MIPNWIVLQVEDDEDSWNLGKFHDHSMKTPLALDVHGVLTLTCLERYIFFSFIVTFLVWYQTK